TPDTGFDCSGLVNYVYRDMLDLRLPRTSRELAEVQGPKVAPEKLAAGDLVFFGSGRQVNHVGIYVGEGRFVHAPTTGGTVRLDHSDVHYCRDADTGARRVLHGLVTAIGTIHKIVAVCAPQGGVKPASSPGPFSVTAA